MGIQSATLSFRVNRTLPLIFALWSAGCSAEFSHVVGQNNDNNDYNDNNDSPQITPPAVRSDSIEASTVSLKAIARDKGAKISWLPPKSPPSEYLLVQSSQSQAPILENGKKYSPGNILEKGSSVIQLGKQQAKEVSTLKNGTTYHFFLFAVYSELYYSNSVGVSVTPRDVTPLPPPLNLDHEDRNNSIEETLPFSWDHPVDKGSVAAYQIAVGSSPEATDILDWTQIGLVNSYTHSGPVPNGEVIYATIRSIDNAGRTSENVTSVGYQNLRCPDDQSPQGVGTYVKVEGDSLPGLGGPYYQSGTQTQIIWKDGVPLASERKLSDFCVAKFEMKLRYDDFSSGTSFTEDIVGDPETSIPGVPYDFELDYANPSARAKYRAVSAPNGKPWTLIGSGQTNIGAHQACELLGTSFRLINNAMWQAIARSIEAMPENWTNAGTPGDPSDDLINRGHSDRDPLSPESAPITPGPDTQPCFATNSPNCSDKLSVDYLQKRTHALSGGGIIWDFGGNVSEWISDMNTRTDGHGAAGELSNGFVSSAPYVGKSAAELLQNILTFGPANDHSHKPDAGLGSFFDGLDPSGLSGIIRGGRWTISENAGIFTTYKYITIGSSKNYLGFRCVYAP